MGPFNPFSAGTVFRRRILTSDVDPRGERIKKVIMAADHSNVGIPLKRKELTKTFMMNSN